MKGQHLVATTTTTQYLFWPPSLLNDAVLHVLRLFRFPFLLSNPRRAYENGRNTPPQEPKGNLSAVKVYYRGQWCHLSALRFPVCSALSLGGEGVSRSIFDSFSRANLRRQWPGFALLKPKSVHPRSFPFVLREFEF